MIADVAINDGNLSGLAFRKSCENLTETMVDSILLRIKFGGTKL